MTDQQSNECETSTEHQPTDSADSYVSSEDLQAIQNIKTKAAYMQVLADNAALQAKLAETEVRNAVLMMFVKYNLSNQHTIDFNNGRIIKKEV